MNQAHRKNQQGFTIIELSLAMAFIAMLLLSIALLTIQISTMYNKGVTLRAVNEAGFLIVRDMQQTLKSSFSENIIFEEEAGTGGRLCANGIVYAWNYGGHTSSGNYGFYGRNRFSTNSSDVRLLRFNAADTYCETDDSGVYPLLPADSSRYTNLLNSGDSTLALHELDWARGNVINDSGQQIYRISFTLGSENGKYIEDNSCQASDGSVQNTLDDSYCAVNTFTFTARAGAYDE